MNRRAFFRRVLVFALLVAGSAGLGAQDAGAARKAWGEVAAPSFVSLAPKAGDPAKVIATFLLVTSTDGADRALVEMRDGAGKLVDSRTIGKSKAETKSVEFSPTSSGVYRFRILASRIGESEAKQSPERTLDFVLPLLAPVPTARNLGNGRLSLEWPAVPEALGYEISQIDGDGAASAKALATINSTHYDIAGLKLGMVGRFVVTAIRGADRSSSQAVQKTIRGEADRMWNFTWFGQSSKAELNTFTLLDADKLSFRLQSCTVAANGQIDQKGGKFTTFHDGISFYYTEIDPAKENFELSATFTVDFINPTPDGQEGFGLLVMDSLGQAGVSMVNHYTNSAGIIATKFEETIAGVKKTSKDTIGARFVTGITPQVLKLGDSGIAQNGKNVSRAFSYESSDLIQAGQSYRLTLRKTNTGYHAMYRNPRAPAEQPTEFLLYGPDKLRQLDADHLYLGFAAARGCNVTVSDVSLVMTSVAGDPAGQEEPPELVPLVMRLHSPQTWTEKDYPLVFRANADGKLSVRDDTGKVLASDVAIKAGQDYRRTFGLASGGSTLFNLSFSVDPVYRPGPGQAIGVWNLGQQAYVRSAQAQNLEFRVYRKIFTGKELYVSPTGSNLGDGSQRKPLDLNTAIMFSRAGQPIVLLPGTYFPKMPLVIERGSDGTAANPKILHSAAGGRAILDFSRAGGGMQVWGNWWRIEGIDICHTPDNVKGLQIGGNHCIIQDVATYQCGDTGLQISGNSYETLEQWPRDNLVLNCTSHDNMDPAANNADGFAAKLTSGSGNVFRGCIAYANIDDGWDLFSKIESGPIGAVLIENCVAYRNGSLSDGSGNGDGNGFKLGGDGIAVPHVIRNSIAFANGTSGITSNSDPAISVENCTSFGNKGSNINLYGKGDGQRSFRLKNVISMKGGAADVYREMPELASADNYLWNGAQCQNSAGRLLGADIFLSVDLGLIPGRRPDGSIDMRGLLVTGPGAPVGVGAGGWR